MKPVFTQKPSGWFYSGNHHAQAQHPKSFVKEKKN
jgi:hypothetical protein